MRVRLAQCLALLLSSIRVSIRQFPATLCVTSAQKSKEGKKTSISHFPPSIPLPLYHESGIVSEKRSRMSRRLEREGSPHHHMTVCMVFLLFRSDYLFKLLLIGDSGVGKSCLLLRFAVSARNRLVGDPLSISSLPRAPDGFPPLLRKREFLF